MEVASVTSAHRKNTLIVNGFVYVKKALENDIVSYECERRRGADTDASACKAKIKVAEDLTVISHLNEHSLPADPVRREVLTVRANLKRKAVESQETPQQILGEELQGVSQEAAVNMAPVRHLRRNVRKARQKASSVILYQLTALSQFRRNTCVFRMVRISSFTTAALMIRIDFSSLEPKEIRQS